MTDDKIEQIRALYFNAKPGTVERDIAKAVAILKSMASEEDRERATVYMEGLAQMRADWNKRRN